MNNSANQRKPPMLDFEQILAVTLRGSILGIGLPAALLSAGCTEPKVEEIALRPVKTQTVYSGQASIRDRVFSGTAQASEEATLSFKVSGTVSRVAVRVGDNIVPGDLIAQLDSESYQVELDQARASQAQANANRRCMDAEYQRSRQLFANNNASRNDLDTALANAESAKADYEAQTQSVRLANLNLAYTRLTAEANCSVASVLIETNENVSSGQSVADVSCGETWEILIAVPESLIAAFSGGMLGNVVFSAFRNETFVGSVTEVGIATGDSTTFPVTLTLESKPENIRSNLAAEVTFSFADQQPDGDTIYVPPVAVGQDAFGTFVYVLEATEESGVGVLERRGVKTGDLNQLGLEVLNGLTDGDRVVIAGRSTARAGMRVLDNERIE
ncbi:MAG: efflux RND transporter periplasmic adaptor subunit [Pseudomonadota bacterium]